MLRVIVQREKELKKQEEDLGSVLKPVAVASQQVSKGK